jgi:hypothetical protein
LLVAELKDIGSSTQGCGHQLDDASGWRVRSNDVKVSGEEPL